MRPRPEWCSSCRCCSSSSRSAARLRRAPDDERRRLVDAAARRRLRRPAHRGARGAGRRPPMPSTSLAPPLLVGRRRGDRAGERRGVDVVVHHALVFAVLTALIARGYVAVAGGRGLSGRTCRRTGAAWSPRAWLCLASAARLGSSDWSPRSCTATAATRTPPLRRLAEPRGRDPHTDDAVTGLAARATVAARRYAWSRSGTTASARSAAGVVRRGMRRRWSPAISGLGDDDHGRCPPGRSPARRRRRPR